MRYVDETERVTFDVFSTEFSQTMSHSFGQYLKGLELCSTPEEMLQLHEEFLLHISTVYGQLGEVVDTAVDVTPYH